MAKCPFCKKSVVDPNKPCESCAKRCTRCGHPRLQHHLVNYADGPLIGMSFLMCPTATFSDEVEE